MHRKRAEKEQLKVQDYKLIETCICLRIDIQVVKNVVRYQACGSGSSISLKRTKLTWGAPRKPSYLCGSVGHHTSILWVISASILWSLRTDMRSNMRRANVARSLEWWLAHNGLVVFSVESFVEMTKSVVVPTVQVDRRQSDSRKNLNTNEVKYIRRYYYYTPSPRVDQKLGWRRSSEKLG